MIVTEGRAIRRLWPVSEQRLEGIRHGRPVFLYNLLDLKRTVWDGPELGPGKHTLRFDFKYDGPGFGKSGTGELFVDGKSVAKKTHRTNDPHHVPGGRDL